MCIPPRMSFTYNNTPLPRDAFVVWDHVSKQVFSLHKNDCSNKSYQLSFFWNKLGYENYIHVSTDSHATVYFNDVGYFDPTDGHWNADHTPRNEELWFKKVIDYTPDFSGNEFSMTKKQFKKIEKLLKEGGYL